MYLMLLKICQPVCEFLALLIGKCANVANTGRCNHSM